MVKEFRRENSYSSSSVAFDAVRAISIPRLSLGISSCGSTDRKLEGEEEESSSSVSGGVVWNGFRCLTVSSRVDFK